MTDPASIRETYARIETEHGGYACADPDEVCEAVAAELGIDPARVREVMIDAWSPVGSG